MTAGIFERAFKVCTLSLAQVSMSPIDFLTAAAGLAARLTKAVHTFCREAGGWLWYNPTPLAAA